MKCDRSWLAVMLVIFSGLATPRPGHAAAPEPLERLSAGIERGFERNLGQTDPDVDFLARGGDASVFLSRGEAVIARGGSTPAVVRLRFAGADAEPTAATATAEGLDPLPGTTSYFHGNDPACFVTGVTSYGRVAYRQVYPGIDLVFYQHGADLEYDLVVAPGADPERITLEIDGARRLRLERGDLVVELPGGGAIRQHRPSVYQEVGGLRQTIAARWTLRGPRRAAFRVAGFDRTRPLVIDPVVVYATYLGGGGEDYGQAVAVDAGKNLYVTGYTESVNFPTQGPLPGTLKGTRDAFVTKFSPSGMSLVYSIYLGGGGEDAGYGIAVDAAGNAYLAGETTSTNFPVVNPVQSSPGGGYDVIVAKIDPAGSSLVYSTYLGGPATDYANAIAVNAAGEAHVTGNTRSANFPTVRPLSPTLSGPRDAFALKLSVAGSSLVYSTFLGGGASDNGKGVGVDADGNAYYGGVTDSTDFPTRNPFQAANKGLTDGYVTKLDPAGALVYSTYLGGSGDDFTQGVAADAAGQVYIAGTTDSIDFPVKNAFQPNLATAPDVFVAKLDTRGRSLVYATYLGGGNGGDDEASAIATDASGNTYLLSWTEEPDFPVTANAPQPLNGGSFDAAVSKLDPSGGLVYSTFLGGDDFDDAYGIAADGAGGAYLTGGTYSLLFPTVNPYQPSYAGSGDAYAAHIGDTTCALPGPVSYLMMVRSASNLVATWDDIPGATSYTVFGDAAKAPLPGTPFGSATTGKTGVTKALPPEPLLYFRVAGENACGFGPK